MNTEDNNNADPEPPFRCSCCDRELNPYTNMAEFQESLHIHYHAGPGSTYIEQGSLVECVLCQGCISVILGRWLRVTPGHAELLPDAELLRGEMPVFFEQQEQQWGESEGDKKKRH